MKTFLFLFAAVAALASASDVLDGDGDSLDNSKRAIDCTDEEFDMCGEPRECRFFSCLVVEGIDEPFCSNRPDPLTDGNECDNDDDVDTRSVCEAGECIDVPDKSRPCTRLERSACEAPTACRQITCAMFDTDDEPTCFNDPDPEMNGTECDDDDPTTESTICIDGKCNAVESTKAATVEDSTTYESSIDVKSVDDSSSDNDTDIPFV